MKLNLTRPIIFFDIEATGLNIAQDRIVELCYIKVFPNGNEASETLRFNPGKHISEEASAVNGIHDEDVADCPSFKERPKTWQTPSTTATWRASIPTTSTFRCLWRSSFAPALISTFRNAALSTCRTSTISWNKERSRRPISSIAEKFGRGPYGAGRYEGHLRSASKPARPIPG